MPPASQAGAVQRYLTVKRDGDDVSHTIDWREIPGAEVDEFPCEEAGEWYIRGNLTLDTSENIITPFSFTTQNRQQSHSAQTPIQHLPKSST
jgi:hypothetical protein